MTWTFRSVLLCIKYYTCTYLYETRTKINIDILDCTHLCSGSATDTYIRRELAPHKRYNVCTRLEFSCWFGLIPVSCKQAYIARNYAIQLHSYRSRLCLSIFLYWFVHIFTYLLAIDPFGKYVYMKNVGKLFWRSQGQNMSGNMNKFSVCDRRIHVFINVLEIARTNHVRKHRSTPGIFNLLWQISTCLHKCPGDRKDKSCLYTWIPGFL